MFLVLSGNQNGVMNMYSTGDIVKAVNIYSKSTDTMKQLYFICPITQQETLLK